MLFRLLDKNIVLFISELNKQLFYVWGQKRSEFAESEDQVFGHNVELITW